MQTHHELASVRVPVTVLPADQTPLWWSVLRQAGWRSFRKGSSHNTISAPARWLLKHEEHAVTFEQLEHVPLPQVLHLPHGQAAALIELFIQSRLLTVQPHQPVLH